MSRYIQRTRQRRGFPQISAREYLLDNNHPKHRAPDAICIASASAVHQLPISRIPKRRDCPSASRSA